VKQENQEKQKHRLL